MATGFTPSPPAAAPAAFTGPALVRLLARLAGPVTPAGEAPPFAERLGQWLHWTDAAALADALEGGPRGTPPASGAAAETADLVQALSRTRETLARSIEADCRDALENTGEAEFAAWRRRVVNRQQALQAGIAPLRARLRAALARRSAPLARLAEVDAVMERGLAAHERGLLATTLPSLLERHFDHLRATRPDDWRPPFCRDLHELLMAELDLRLQPAEGLLAALRAAPAADPAP